VLAACDVFLGTDSGVMHMAAAAGCQVVAIFGPGEPRWFGPAGEGHSLIIERVMPCRPCFDACIYPSPVCMTNISDHVIADTVDSRLRNLPSAHENQRTRSVSDPGFATSHNQAG
jgi:ADP-heptose:LPS heptosyltransferase